MVRIAAVSDIHYRPDQANLLAELFATASGEADVLLLGGDLTDHGHLEQAEALGQLIRRHAHVPVLAVLGNHDHDGGHADEITKLLCDEGVHMLDGEGILIDGVGFAGVKGYVGGFDERALGPFGEAGLKHLVQESVEEALKLEAALSRINGHTKVALMHYAPIRATVEGEPPEIFPFLGSSRLEDPLNHYHVEVAFHGHAHKGAFEGRAAGGTRVFNVAVPVLRARFPDRLPFFTYDIQPQRDAGAGSLFDAAASQQDARETTPPTPG